MIAPQSYMHPPWFPFNTAGGGGGDAFTVKVSNTDTTPGFLSAKLQAGYNIHFTTLNPAGNEIINIDGIIYWDEFNNEGGGGIYATRGQATWKARNVTALPSFDVVIEPTGNGGFALIRNDAGLTVNQRGTNAVDLQIFRADKTQVASGAYSFLAGYRGRAAGERSIVLCTSGNSNIGTDATATGAVMIGNGLVTTHPTYGAATDSYTIGWGGGTSGNLNMNIGHQQTVYGAGSYAFGNMNNIQVRQCFAYGNFNQWVDANNNSINNYAFGFSNGLIGTPTANCSENCFYGWENRTTTAAYQCHLWGYSNTVNDAQGAYVLGRSNTVRQGTIGVGNTTYYPHLFGHNNIAELQCFVVGHNNSLVRANVADPNEQALLHVLGGYNTIVFGGLSPNQGEMATIIGNGVEAYNGNVIHFGSYDTQAVGQSTAYRGQFQEGKAQAGAETSGAVTLGLSIGWKGGKQAFTQQLEVPANTTWVITGRIAARRTDGGGVGQSWGALIEAVVENTAGVVRIVGQATNVIANDAALAGCAAVVAVDAATDSIDVNVTGVAAIDLHWAGSIDFTQVQ